jgi:hypothetical protein
MSRKNRKLKEPVAGHAENRKLKVSVAVKNSKHISTMGQAENGKMMVSAEGQEKTENRWHLLQVNKRIQ